MRRYIVLLLITGTLWAQTKLDKLVLKDGTEYQGKYLRTEKSFVHFNQFKSKNRWLARSISIQDVQTIQLKDGGNLKLPPEKIDVLDLSIKEQAVLDAKRDAKKWLAYPPLALISAGGLGTATFFIGEDIFDMPDELALLPSIFAGSFGAVISYNLFSESDKKGTNGTSDSDIELYKEIYSNEFKKRKSNYIITSSVIVGVTALIGAWIILSSIDMSGYDACFDPRCD